MSSPTLTSASYRYGSSSDHSLVLGIDTTKLILSFPLGIVTSLVIGAAGVLIVREPFKSEDASSGRYKITVALLSSMFGLKCTASIYSLPLASRYTVCHIPRAFP